MGEEDTMKRSYEVDYPIAKKFARVRLLTQAIFLSSGMATGMFVAHAASVTKALTASQTTTSSTHAAASAKNGSGSGVASSRSGANSRGTHASNTNNKSIRASSNGATN